MGTMVIEIFVEGRQCGRHRKSHVANCYMELTFLSHGLQEEPLLDTLVLGLYLLDLFLCLVCGSYQMAPLVNWKRCISLLRYKPGYMCLTIRIHTKIFIYFWMDYAYM